MDEHTDASTEPANREITITRIVDAPRDLVFEAWTDAEHIARWWGPEGFTVPECVSDPRPGGSLMIVMRGPDGADYPMTGIYRVVVRPKRLVFESTAVGADGEPVLEALQTVTFADHDGKTEITVHARATALVPKAVAMLGGMEAGWTQSLQCLDDFLTGVEDRQIVLSRVFEAPRELVFRAFTEQDQVAQWWGPTGFTLTIHEMDVRPGGTWRSIMHGPDGVDYPNTIVYEEITAPAHLVYRHEDPAFRVTVTLDDFSGMTALTMRMVFATAEERDGVVDKYNAIEGGNQTLERLGAHLAAMSLPTQGKVKGANLMSKITPFLWFDDNAEEAMNFYVSIFGDAKVVNVTRYGEAGPGPAGTVMTATFELRGQEFTALNGGPNFTFSEAISFVVSCETQEEVDELWEKLSAGGEQQQCGWLKDRYGLSWQIVPTALGELFDDPDPAKLQRVMAAMLQMTKIDIQGLRQAYEQRPAS